MARAASGCPFCPSASTGSASQAPGFSETAQDVELTVGSAFDVTLQLSVARGIQQRAGLRRAACVEVDRARSPRRCSRPRCRTCPSKAATTSTSLSCFRASLRPTRPARRPSPRPRESSGQGYSVNSQRNFSNGFIVDGLSDNDDAAGVAGNVFSMDVVREFQVVTSGGQAEFGRALGGYFNIVTKSGTNQLHGTAYGFLRNQRLNADNALSGNKLPLTQGPVRGKPLRAAPEETRPFSSATSKNSDCSTARHYHGDAGECSRHQCAA